VIPECYDTVEEAMKRVSHTMIHSLSIGGSPIRHYFGKNQSSLGNKKDDVLLSNLGSCLAVEELKQRDIHVMETIQIKGR